MVLLRLLAIAGLILSISSVATAAPVSVTYGFTGTVGGGDASFGMAGSGGVGNVTGGTITIVYGSGSALASGTVGPISAATHASMLLSATGVTLLSQPVPGWALGNLTVHTPILGFQGSFTTPASGVTITGSAAVQVFNIAPGLIAFNGFGLAYVQPFGLGPYTWEVDNGANGNTFGAEISRSVIPEPTTGLLVGAGLVGLGLVGGRRSIRS